MLFPTRSMFFTRTEPSGGAFDPVNDDPNIIFALAPEVYGGAYQEWASQTTPATAASDPVGSFVDPVNSLIIAASADARRPVIVEDGDGVLAWRFDAVDDCLFSSATLPTGGVEELYAIVVFVRIGSSTGSRIFELSGHAAVTPGTCFLAVGAAGDIDACIRSNNASDYRILTYNMPSSQTVKHLLESYYDASDGTQDTWSEVRQNGGSALTVASATNNGPTAGTFLDRPLYIGARGNAAWRINADLYCLILRTGMPDATLLTNYRTWAQNSFGFTL